MGIFRLLLAISVVIIHSQPIYGLSLVGGIHAVHAFYIISGFYMSLILNEKYTSETPNSYRLYITNRFLRLYPIYWVVLIFALLFSLSNIQTIKHLATDKTTFDLYIIYNNVISLPNKIFLFLSNIIIIGQDTLMFLGLNKENGEFYFTKDFNSTDPKLYKFLLVPQAWTLALELTFYIIAPFLVRKKTVFILTLILISFTCRLLAIKYGLDKDPWNYRFFPFELGFFLLGSISYKIYVQIKRLKLNPLYSKISLVTILLITILFYNLPYKTIIFYSATFLLLPFIFLATKNNKLDRYIGELSFPVYISHILVWNILNSVQILQDEINGLTLVICSMLVAILINEVVNKRIEKIREKRTSKLIDIIH